MYLQTIQIICLLLKIYNIYDIYDIYKRKIFYILNICFSDNESKKINNFLYNFIKIINGTSINYFTENKNEIYILEKKYISIISDVLSQINKSEITTIITSSLLYLNTNNIQEQEEIDQLMKNKL